MLQSGPGNEVIVCLFWTLKPAGYSWRRYDSHVAVDAVISSYGKQDVVKIMSLSPLFGWLLVFLQASVDAVGGVSAAA